MLPSGPKDQSTWILVGGITLVIIGFIMGNIITIITGFLLIILSLFWTRIRKKLEITPTFRAA